MKNTGSGIYECLSDILYVSCNLKINHNDFA